MLGPAPSRPVVLAMFTPGALPDRRSPRSGAWDSDRRWDASTVETTFPISRFSWAPAVPVTTTWLSDAAAVCSARSTVAC